MKPRLPTQREQQRGAATLVVVMVLFLVMALLAAYANRSLVFEQRIANGYYRASLAQEMAEGGLDWTVAMLNGTAIDGNCEPVAAGGTRFVRLASKLAARRSRMGKIAARRSRHCSVGLRLPRSLSAAKHYRPCSRRSNS